jgi:hypothetical protein
MTVTEFNDEAKKWIETAKHPRWNRLYAELTYQPMLEVLRYLRDNAYKTYIVTGGGQDFVRVYSEKVYGIPAQQVVGTAGGTKYGCGKDGKPFGRRTWKTSSGCRGLLSATQARTHEWRRAFSQLALSRRGPRARSSTEKRQMSDFVGGRGRPRRPREVK